MKLLEFSKLNPFLVKMTILITVFISSFFFNHIEYFNDMLKLIVFAVLSITLFIKVVKDIFKKRGFTKNFDVFFSAIVVACISKLDMAIITLIIYEFICFFNKDKIDSNQLIVKRGKKTYSVDIGNVKINDILLLKRKDVVKLECNLVNDCAVFLTDDNKIMEKKSGDIIPVGYKCLSTDVSVKVIQKYKDSITKNKDIILDSLKNNEQEYIYYSKIIRVVSFILIFVPNLLTGVIQKELIMLGANLLLIKDMRLFIYLDRTLLDRVLHESLKQNIFVKDKDVFGRLLNIKNIIFEKTETLTLGEFRITQVETENKTEFFKYLNYAECFSNHRIAEVIKKYKKVSVDKNKIKKFKEIPQRGVECRVDKDSIVVGNSYFLKDKGIDFDKCYEVGTVIYLAVNKKCLGHIVISDSVKCSTKEVINELKNSGIKTFTVMSGDNEKIVNAISYTLGIKDKYSNLTTDEKVFWTKHIKDYHKGNFLIVGNKDTEEKFLELGDLSLILGDNSDSNCADIYIKDKSLERLPILFNISKKYISLLKKYRILTCIFKVLFVGLPLWVILLIEEIYMNIIDRGGRLND